MVMVFEQICSDMKITLVGFKIHLNLAVPSNSEVVPAQVIYS